MKKQILSALILLVAVVLFNRCEKEGIEAPVTEKLTENSTNVSLKQNPIETIIAAQISQVDSSIFDLGNDRLENRDGKQLIGQADVTINQGQWALAFLYKSQLSAGYLYTAVVTPYNGDPDLYIHGRQPGNSGAFRQIRSSRNYGTEIEQETASVADLTSSEDRLYFSIYGQTSTHFLLQIFKEAIATPASTPGFLSNENWTNEPFIGIYGNYFADVTGDGKADAIAVEDNQIRVRRATGNSFAPVEIWYNYPYWGTKGTFFADVTGDGKADAIAVNETGIVVSRSTGSGFAPFTDWSYTEFFGAYGTFFADVNGDKKADIIAVGKDYIRVRRSTGNGFAAEQRWTNDLYYGSYFMDVNCDGKADAIAIYTDYIGVRHSTGNGFAQEERWTNGNYNGLRGIFFADVTGDHKTDAIAVNDNYTNVRRSTGNSFAPEERWLNEPHFGTQGNYFIDVTGDGKADFVALNNDRISVSRSK